MLATSILPLAHRQVMTGEVRRVASVLASTFAAYFYFSGS
jgi:hypothetical protein